MRLFHYPGWSPAPLPWGLTIPYGQRKDAVISLPRKACGTAGALTVLWRPAKLTFHEPAWRRSMPAWAWHSRNRRLKWLTTGAGPMAARSPVFWSYATTIAVPAMLMSLLRRWVLRRILYTLI